MLWYRNKYNLPGDDPRLLSLSVLDIILERERFLYLENNTPHHCPKCDIQTYRDVCPVCWTSELSMGPTGDDLIDEIIERENHGEVIDLDDIFGRKSPRHKKVSWEANK